MAPWGLLWLRLWSIDAIDAYIKKAEKGGRASDEKSGEQAEN